MLKTVVLVNIFSVETIKYFFQDYLMNTILKEQHLFEI